MTDLNISNNKWHLSIQDTNVLKGIAIVLLLIHHLFGERNGLYDDVHIYKDYYLVNQIGIFSKLCVSIFVFLSGYGLMIQADEKGSANNLKHYYIHRFKKLYLNYWIIWLCFVPISYFVFDFTFQDAYHSKVLLHLIVDLLGIHNIFFESVGQYSYNPTWWFYSCIIILYAFFPLLYKWMKKDVLSLVMFAVSFFFFSFPHTGYVRPFFLSFILGMWLSISSISSFPFTHIRWPLNLYIFILLGLILFRNLTSCPLFLDNLMTFIIVVLYQSFKASMNRYIIRSFEFLGQHSMNIFLFHTFIFYFWFQQFIYASRNPLIIFFTLLAICIPISITLEWIKKYTIYKL